MKTGRVCCLAALFSVASAVPACNPLIEKEVDDTKVNMLMQQATAGLNEEWPSMAADRGLDPRTIVTNFEKHIGGKGKDYCKAYCGLKKSSCHAFKLHVDEILMHGLGDATFGDFQVSDWDLLGQGAQCDLQVNASAPLAADLSIELKGANMKFQCKNMWGKKKSTTIWKGKGSCQDLQTGPNAALNLILEQSVTDPAEQPDMESTTIDLDLDKASMTQNCKMDDDGGIQSGIINAFFPAVMDSIFTLITLDMSGAVAGLNIADFMVGTMVESHRVSSKPSSPYSETLAPHV